MFDAVSSVSGVWPSDVGIISAELYFPNSYVDQSELEVFDGVSAGKYTIGLGQKAMSFCTDREDVCSLSLTVVSKLLARENIDPKRIGRLEVGTETLIDKSKSVKTVLMQLFSESGNHDIEGIDTINACFGGTQALFNAVNWVESSSYDGPARCTGGAGAVAFLVGPNAALVLDRGLRAFHIAHNYDFYKPNLSCEYPMVDGKLSVKCYTEALDNCYQLYLKKAKSTGIDVKLNELGSVVFHVPYCRLVQKSLARLCFVDQVILNWPDKQLADSCGKPTFAATYESEEVYRKVEKVFLENSKSLYMKVTAPSLVIANEVGNMYTPSLYAALLSSLSNLTSGTSTDSFQTFMNKRILLFSYGSGSAAVMFSLVVSEDKNRFSRLLSGLLNLREKLHHRTKFSPEEFTRLLAEKQAHYGKCDITPTHSTDYLSIDTYYLTKIDEKYRRSYAIKK